MPRKLMMQKKYRANAREKGEGERHAASAVDARNLFRDCADR